MAAKLYRVVAWGSDTHPDLDCEMDENPRKMLNERGYRFQEVAIQRVITYCQIKTILDQREYYGG